MHPWGVISLGLDYRPFCLLQYLAFCNFYLNYKGGRRSLKLLIGLVLRPSRSGSEPKITPYYLGDVQDECRVHISC